MNAKADTPKSAYPLNKQYKKYCIRCIPTLALSKSGYGSRPLSLLSACCRQAPHLFSCQVSQNNSCKTYGQLLSDVSSQTLSLTDGIIALHFFNCNISFRIFRIVLEWCYLKQITAWGYKIYYLGEITLWQTRQKRRIRPPPDIRNATSASIWFVFWQFFLSCTIIAKLISFIIMCHTWDCATFFPCAEQLSANADHRFSLWYPVPWSFTKKNLSDGFFSTVFYGF